MADERIYIGSVITPTLAFNNTNIESVTCNNALNLIGDELSSDTLEVSVFFTDTDHVFEGDMYAVPIWYYSNNKLVGKYYINQIERQDVKKYLIRATSLIGLIEKEDFYGGFYTGKLFSDVVDDILFTNGVSLTKYKMYTPIGYPIGDGIWPEKVWFGTPTAAGWKNRIHLAFIYRGDYDNVSSGDYTSTVFGTWGNYGVTVTSRLSNGGNLTCGVSVRYNSYLYSVGDTPDEAGYKMIGIGSRFAIDVDPVAGTGSIKCNYINPDTSSSGYLETNWTFSASTSTSPVYMTCAFGGNDTFGDPNFYTAKLQWQKYKVYNGDGEPLIDAVFVLNESETASYVVNAADGYMKSTDNFIPYGLMWGYVSDFTRIERDLELQSSIIYGQGVENLPVRGWINRTTRREALHQLLFSMNVSMLKSDDGYILFTKLSNSQDRSIADDNIYDDSGEKTVSAAKKISITEHSYETSGSSSETIFDNSSGGTPPGQYIAVFDKAPIYGTPTAGSGVTILASNCNVALITGKGTITGTPYVHSKNIIQYVSGSTDGADISVPNVGLITTINSDSVMGKLKSYYSGKLKQISNSIKYSGERCGLKYGFKSLYSNSNSAYLTKIVAQSSSFVKARCEFISGYTPVNAGGYTSYAIVTPGSVWNVPDEIRSSDLHTVRLNIIGRGSDGTSGSNGSAGNVGSSGSGARSGGNGGAGGAGGTGGQGGYVYSVSVDVTNISTIRAVKSSSQTFAYTYTAGGSVVNTYSSNSGSRSDTGFMNVFTGIQYARKGKDGIAGGAGGKGGYCTLSGSDISMVMPENGQDVGEYAGGGSYPWVIRSYQSTYGSSYIYNSYGGGGGAAYGDRGNYASWVAHSGAYHITSGGDGSDASPPDNVYTEYGSGGFGGNGGGGGGGAGNAFVQASAQSGYTYETEAYYAGSYGKGSSGTNGIDGCLIIYY